MAVADSFEHKPASSPAALLLAPFRAIGRALMIIAESSARYKAVERLNRMSDAQLAAKGLTREAEIRRIMGLAYVI